MPNFEESSDKSSASVRPERPPERRYTPSGPRNGDDKERTSMTDHAERQPTDPTAELSSERAMRLKREELDEQERLVKSLRGLIVETINVLYREYNVRSLKYLRMRVEDSQTAEELKVAADMLLTIGRFHEVASIPESPRSQSRG